VAALCAGLSPTLRRSLIDPLCVAALNTPASRASAQVFLRVLKDALFSGPGSADLLLPTADLGVLLPDAALDWLAARGTIVALGQRVTALHREPSGWLVETAVGGAAAAGLFDRIILAASPTQAAHLAAPHAPGWSAQVSALRLEPIVTVLLRAPPGTRLAQPMLMLEGGAQAPADVLFDLGALRGRDCPAADGVLAAVVSGAGDWVEQGLAVTGLAAQAQVARALSIDVDLLKTHAEKRATFLCVPGLDRGSASLAPGLLAAGDHLSGPYPSTLEGAVRSGLAAVDLLQVSTR
jgi:hypothetical protein